MGRTWKLNPECDPFLHVSRLYPDNSPHNVLMLEQGKEFNPVTWTEWVTLAQVKAAKSISLRAGRVDDYRFLALRLFLLGRDPISLV